jgi:hypothetical protein
VHYLSNCRRDDKCANGHPLDWWGLTLKLSLLSFYVITLGETSGMDILYRFLFLFVFVSELVPRFVPARLELGNRYDLCLVLV